MILIVDDKPENVLSLRAVLEMNSFTVDAAYSGEEALKKVLREHYFLIILDVQMPGMDGFEVAEAITSLSRTRDIPIIFLSAVNTHKRFVTKGFESGGVDYLTKPVDPDILILKVRNFYRMYQQNQELAQAHRELQAEVDRRKQAQQELSVTVEELHSTLESLPQIAFTAKPDGTLDFVNRHWYEWAESRRSFPQTVEGDQPMSELWQSIVATGEPARIELRLARDGSARYFLFHAIPVFREGSIRKWVGTFTDIHEQRMLSEVLEARVAERTAALTQINRELEVTNHDLQQFASVASHDLREPLRKIQLFTNMITEKDTPSETTLYYLDKINASSRRMATLINDLLAVTRLSESALFEQTDFNELVSEALTDLELTIAETGARIDISPLPIVEVIPGLIRQLVLNIVSNSIKFAKKEEAPWIRIEADRCNEPDEAAPSMPDGAYCRLRISDNGIGFNEQYAHKIFTLFQRLNNRDAYEGTGIGLAIVKKIVEKHHGHIAARSKEGVGSTFIVWLPVSQQSIQNLHQNI